MTPGHSVSGSPPHIVIVGGGFGGLAAARALAGGPVRVTMIDRTNHHLFQPLLYQVAMAGLAPSEIATPIRSVLGKLRNVQVLLAEVVRIELTAREVWLSDSDEPVAYDYLIVAAGTENHFFGHDEWAPHAMPLKDLDDAVEIRRRVLLAFESAERATAESARKAFTTFAIIGGGPTGVELAGALAELSRRVIADDFRVIRPGSARVILIEASDRLLAAFHPELSESATKQLEELGVEIRLRAAVTGLSEDGVLLGEEHVPCKTVLWAAGVRPSKLGETINGAVLDRRKRVVVGPDCSIEGYPEAFAIGDVACFVQDGQELAGVSPVAMQQGRYVARTIREELRDKPRAPFRYFDKGIMATIGRSRAVVEMGPIRISGFWAWMTWLFIHVVYLVDFRNRVLVMLQWFWSYLFYRNGARLITGARKRKGSP